MIVRMQEELGMGAGMRIGECALATTRAARLTSKK
jgi:hypothetical protein